MFWKKKKQPKYSDEEKRMLLDEILAVRSNEILTESLELMRTTKHPKTFFGRYNTALSNAERILAQTHVEEVRQYAQSVYDDLTDRKDEIVKSYIDRCYREGILRAIKDDLLSGEYELSPTVTRYICNLIKRMESEAAETAEEGEYIYCSVSFGADGRTYYYKTNDKTFKCGDKVIVPVGENGMTKVAKIEKIERFKAGRTPYPPRKTKNIIARA